MKNKTLVQMKILRIFISLLEAFILKYNFKSFEIVDPSEHTKILIKFTPKFLSCNGWGNSPPPEFYRNLQKLIRGNDNGLLII